MKLHPARQISATTAAMIFRSISPAEREIRISIAREIFRKIFRFPPIIRRDAPCTDIQRLVAWQVIGRPAAETVKQSLDDWFTAKGELSEAMVPV